VVGLCEAALKMASSIATRIAIVTSLPRSIAPIEANVAHYGMSHRVRVRASGIPVLDLKHPTPDVLARLTREIEAAIEQDRAEAIVLGCAGMAELAADLSARFGLPVIDGVAAAVKQAEALVGLGLRTSKIGAYAAPARKPFAGALAGVFAASLPGSDPSPAQLPRYVE
jgi:allantoin racemase